MNMQHLPRHYEFLYAAVLAGIRLCDCFILALVHNLNSTAGLEVLNLTSLSSVRRGEIDIHNQIAEISSKAGSLLRLVYGAMSNDTDLIGSFNCNPKWSRGSNWHVVVFSDRIQSIGRSDHSDARFLVTWFDSLASCAYQVELCVVTPAMSRGLYLAPAALERIANFKSDRFETCGWNLISCGTSW